MSGTKMFHELIETQKKSLSVALLADNQLTAVYPL